MAFVPIAAAAIGAIGSWLGSRNMSREMQKARDADAKYRKLIEDAMKESMPYGTQMIAGGARNFQDASNYWAPLLKGDRSALSNAGMPGLAGIADNYQQQAQNAGEMGRGGDRTSFWGNLPFQQGKEQSLLLSQLQNSAAHEAGSLGSEMTSAGQGIINGGNASGFGLMGQSRQSRNDEFGMGSQYGSSIANLIGNIDWSKVDWSRFFGAGNTQGQGGAGTQGFNLGLTPGNNPYPEWGQGYTSIAGMYNGGSGGSGTSGLGMGNWGNPNLSSGFSLFGNNPSKHSP